jgi:hypothetical protein
LHDETEQTELFPMNTKAPQINNAKISFNKHSMRKDWSISFEKSQTNFQHRGNEFIEPSSANALLVC